jgi:glutamate--cysteine ligase
VNLLLQNKILAKRSQVEDWLKSQEKDVPLFMSADIRDGGFKIASIDANLYPAGFNNLHPSFHPLAIENLGGALTARSVSAGSRLLLVSEEHTRNLFYLENIHVLSTLLSKAGYEVDITTQFPLSDADYAGTSVHLHSASGQPVTFIDPRVVENSLSKYQAIVMNHDSSAGSADWIKMASIPVLPAWQAGWHTRSKARHFAHYRTLMQQFGALVGLDPWFFCPLDQHVTGIDINSDDARIQVAAKAEVLLKDIQQRYDEYRIAEKPFVFLKSDHGTYGMAMLAFDSASEILEINRKEKNKLFKGKSSVVVHDYLLQEGVPTILQTGGHFAESVVMLANNQFIGKFGRVNEQKGARTSLNSTGMYFKQIAADACNDNDTIVASLITRVAGIALQREICELVTPNEPCFSDRPA